MVKLCDFDRGFKIDSKVLSEDDEREIFEEMFSTAEKNGFVKVEALKRVVSAYQTLKEMLKDNKRARVKIEFSRPFGKLVADVTVTGSKELHFKDAKALSALCKEATSSIEVLPGTDKVLHLSLSYYGLER